LFSADRQIGRVRKVGERKFATETPLQAVDAQELALAERSPSFGAHLRLFPHGIVNAPSVPFPILHRTDIVARDPCTATGLPDYSSVQSFFAPLLLLLGDRRRSTESTPSIRGGADPPPQLSHLFAAVLVDGAYDLQKPRLDRVQHAAGGLRADLDRRAKIAEADDSRANWRGSGNQRGVLRSFLLA